jgi:antitoxin ParD1/3/4
MDSEKRTKLKHDKMIAEAEEDIREGRIYSQAAVEKIIQSWTKEDFETGKSLMEELELGEKSGFVKDFDAVENLKQLHAKHLPHGI